MKIAQAGTANLREMKEFMRTYAVCKNWPSKAIKELGKVLSFYEGPKKAQITGPKTVIGFYPAVV